MDVVDNRADSWLGLRLNVGLSPLKKSRWCVHIVENNRCFMGAIDDLLRDLRVSILVLHWAVEYQKEVVCLTELEHVHN